MVLPNAAHPEQLSHPFALGGYAAFSAALA
jgi:hypothetical protein